MRVTLLRKIFIIKERGKTYDVEEDLFLEDFSYLNQLKNFDSYFQQETIGQGLDRELIQNENMKHEKVQLSFPFSQDSTGLLINCNVKKKTYENLRIFKPLTFNICKSKKGHKKI